MQTKAVLVFLWKIQDAFIYVVIRCHKRMMFFCPSVALRPFETLSHASKQCHNNTIMRINRQRLPFIALVKVPGTFTFYVIFLPVTEEESDHFKTMLVTTHNLRQSIKMPCSVSSMSLRSNRMRAATHSAFSINP